MKKVKVLLSHYDPKTQSKVHVALTPLKDKIEYVNVSSAADYIINCYRYYSDRNLNMDKKSIFDKIEELHAKINKNNFNFV